MDMDSPDKSMEEIKEGDGAPAVEEADLNLYVNDEQRGESFGHKSEVLNDGMQAYSNQEYPSSPMLHVGVENEGLQSPIMKSNSADSSSPVKQSGESCLPIESDADYNDVERRNFDYCSMEDYQSFSRKEGPEGADHVALPGEFLDNNENETFDNEVQTEDSNPLVRNPLLTGDSNNHYEIMGGEAFTHELAKSPTFVETVNGGLENAATNSLSEKADVNVEMDGGNLSRYTETKEDNYSSLEAPSENGGMVWENSSLHSPQRTENASPSPERRFSISAERSPHSQPSPHTHPSLRQEEVPSPANSDKKSAPSPRSSRRKYSPSPEKRSVGRNRASSRDRSSPSVRQKSPSGRTTQQDSHHRDSSPRRHASASPRRQDSQRRRGRSASRSPARRKASPGHRRDQRRRSRSRSPYARDRNRRSPRRRHSPRHRSPPPSYSRRRSPRRPWSPPANRSTGVGRPGNNLFVAGFSYVTTERDLEKKFSRFGRVTDVRIVRDRRSGESRGFGFLSLERDEDADAAIRALDQTEWNGRIVLVEKSKTSSR